MRGNENKIERQYKGKQIIEAQRKIIERCDNEVSLQSKSAGAFQESA